MERVYHYTSMGTFLSLLENVNKSTDKNSFVFWATDIFFLNDPQEYAYGQEILLDVLKEIEYDKKVDDNLCLSLLFSRHPGKTKEKWLEDLRNSIIDNNQSPYVISFSRNGDSLPMWLSYADGGKGVCMAFAEYRNQFVSDSFAAQNINEMAVDIYDNLGTYDVEYNNYTDKDNRLRKNLEYMYDYYLDKLKTISPNKYLELQNGMLRGLTIVHAPYIKNKDYEGEREVRLAKTIDNKGNPYEIKFRINAKGHIIPYIEVEIPVTQLDYVKIGPLTDKDLSTKVINMMKKKYEVDFDVRESEIKFRDY